MGCDIHIYSEGRLVDPKLDWRTRQLLEDEGKPIPTTWQPTDPWGMHRAPGLSFASEMPEEITDKDGEVIGLKMDGLSVPWEFSLVDGRHYGLFAVLNNVRNYNEVPSFFGDGRVVPDDSCLMIKTEYERGGSDWHSPCWGTLAEFKQMREWLPTQVIRAWGVIDKKEMIAMMEQGFEFSALARPSVQQGAFGRLGSGSMSSGEDEVYLSNRPLDTYSRGMAGGGLKPVRIEWDENLLEHIGEEAVDQIIRGLEFRKKQFKIQSDEDIRAVWWYDN